MPKRTVALLLLLLAAPLAAYAQSLDEQLMAAVRKSDVEAVKVLLEKGANVNAKTQYGATPLSYACDRGSVEIVKMLLDKGADVNAQDTFYRATPIVWASMKGHAQIIKMLLDKGATGNDQVLVMAVSNGHTDIVKVSLEKGGLSEATLTTALSRAERENRKEIADLLKAAGAKPAPKADFQVDAETLKSYAGVYKHDQIGEMIFTLADGKLTGRLAGQNAFTMGAYDKTTFKINEVEATIKFNLENDKVVSCTLRQGGGSFDFKRVEQK